MQYRFRIPVCGAIILNTNLDKCVLVKGWSSKSGWGFPKGKINQDEEYDCCAIREVLEETGYDVGPLLKKPDFIELTMREQRIRLYIIQGVPEDTQFIPRTRKEISQISWIKLDDLPTYKATEPKPGNGSLNYVKSGPYRFYMVVPFMNKLRQFVNQRKKSLKKDNQKMKGSASPHPRAPAQSQATPQNAAQQSSIIIPPSPNNKPVESTNALKSLLGVNHGDSNNGFAASPAVSQPQPESQPPQPNTNNLLDQLFAANAQHQQQQSSASQQQSPNLLQKLQLASQQANSQAQHTPNQQSGEVHRASFVEELLKQQQYNQQHQQKQQQQQQQSPPLMNDNMRRNSLLSVLQGRSNDSSPAPMNPSMNPLEVMLRAQNQNQQQQQSYYAD
ncbi:hypothetical protein HMPREF1544_10720 [Mucor circinelloides 1006PhL]|uniref:Nudix hydrolase domain-containing protein n=1 Tax=Mucor circinelloides f. circinelloides (strain 1006PhL) TaxID=1220926 RepID=S2JJ46_MUCC1|nr:hypothetical protein HMPREF1544_10720 [Mucor circinelloides 1006PhL]